MQVSILGLGNIGGNAQIGSRHYFRLRVSTHFKNHRLLVENFGDDGPFAVDFYKRMEIRE